MLDKIDDVDAITDCIGKVVRMFLINFMYSMAS